MESCPFKTVLSGGMGFALGGAFGLFMSSVGEPLEIPAQKKTSLKLDVRSSDELRYASQCARSTIDRSTAEGAIETRLQGYGNKIF